MFQSALIQRDIQNQMLIEKLEKVEKRVDCLHLKMNGLITSNEWVRDYIKKNCHCSDELNKRQDEECVLINETIPL